MKNVTTIFWVLLNIGFLFPFNALATSYSSSGIFSDYKRALKVKPEEVIQLTLNGYEEIPKGVYKFNNLSKLTIRNGLKKLPADLYKVGKMETLILIDNPIQQIPENIKLCRFIREIKIINSNLVEIPSSLFELPQLINLTIKNSKLNSLPLIKKDNLVLKLLNLKNNNLTFINDDLQHLIALEAFYCSGNPIKSLSGNFSNPRAFKDLKTLVMRDCSLEHIPTVFCSNLQYLDISGNKITDITDGELLSLNNLLFIGLEDNPITYLNEKLFTLNKLKTIQIDRYESLSIELSDISNVCVTFIAVHMELIDKNYKPCGQKKGMISVYFSEPGRHKK